MSRIVDSLPIVEARQRGQLVQANTEGNAATPRICEASLWAETIQAVDCARITSPEPCRSLNHLKALGPLPVTSLPDCHKKLHALSRPQARRHNFVPVNPRSSGPESVLHPVFRGGAMPVTRRQRTHLCVGHPRVSPCSMLATAPRCFPFEEKFFSAISVSGSRGSPAADPPPMAKRSFKSSPLSDNQNCPCLLGYCLSAHFLTFPHCSVRKEIERPVKSLLSATI
jgi:hypothetical protein